MPSIGTAAPQFLVTSLSNSLAFYKERLGFKTDFVYGDFYASVSRDGAPIHLKCASKLKAERDYQIRPSTSMPIWMSPVSGISTKS